MNIKFYLAIFSASLLIISCSNPLDKEFNRETAEADFIRLVKLGKLDSTETYVMGHFMVEHDLIGAQVLEIGATYRDILQEAKTFWRKNGKVSNEVQSKESESDRLIEIEATPEERKIEQSAWSSALPYKLSIRNVSDKSIKAFKGKFIFIDAFGEPLHEVEYKYLNSVEPNQTVDEKVNFRILHVVSPNKIVQYSEKNPFTVRWQADSVITN